MLSSIGCVISHHGGLLPFHIFFGFFSVLKPLLRHPAVLFCLPTIQSSQVAERAHRSSDSFRLTRKFALSGFCRVYLSMLSVEWHGTAAFRNPDSRASGRVNPNTSHQLEKKCSKEKGVCMYSHIQYVYILLRGFRAFSAYDLDFDRKQTSDVSKLPKRGHRTSDVRFTSSLYR